MAETHVQDMIENGTFKVKQEPWYKPQKDEVDIFRKAYEMKKAVALIGPTGCGKTRLVEYMAYNLDMPLHAVTCHEELAATDLIGRYLIINNQTEWMNGPLLMAIKNGGIAYLDEIAEARKDVTICVHSLTDHRRYIDVEKIGKRLYAPDEFMLVTSYNPGYQSMKNALKPSTRQRFITIELGWPEENLEVEIVRHESGIDEDVARNLVKAAQRIRNLVKDGLEEGVSTREIIYAAELMKSGVSPRASVETTMVNPLTDDAYLKNSIREVLANYIDMGEQKKDG